VPPLSDTALANDNGAHDAIWQSPIAQSQIHSFLAPDGQVQSVCASGCNISPYPLFGPRPSASVDDAALWRA
jgi:hypothetical protein